MTTPPKISAYVIAYNEAEKISQTLASIQWADEIVVADSFSTDGTAEIAESMGARVIQVPFSGFGDLRNKALEACSGDWIFSLDSDERCTPEVRDEVLKIVCQASQNLSLPDIYLVPRRNYFMGRWIRHSGWYPNFRQPQLFKKGAMSYDLLPVHEGYVAHSQKPIGRLKSAVWQFPFKNLAEVMHKANRYSSLGAEKVVHKRVGYAGSLIHAIWSFLKHYVFKLGFLDGWPGLVIAMGNFQGTLFRYLKAIELREQRLWLPPVQDPIQRDSSSRPFPDTGLDNKRQGSP